MVYFPLLFIEKHNIHFQIFFLKKKTFKVINNFCYAHRFWQKYTFLHCFIDRQLIISLLISSLIQRRALNFIIKFFMSFFFLFFPSFIDLWLDNIVCKTTFYFFILRILLWLSEKRHTLVYLVYFCLCISKTEGFRVFSVLRSLFWVSFYLIRTLWAPNHCRWWLQPWN